MTTGHLTATAVALRCVGKPPPQPDKRTRYTGREGAECCICAGPANAHGPAFKRQGVVAETFVRPDDMAWEQSDAVCGACVFFITPSTFHGCVEGRLPHVKLWPQASWRSYSHLFADGDHRVMKPSDWRAFLIDPPAPPFVAVVSTNGKKNILHRAEVGFDRACYPVQLDEETVWVWSFIIRDYILLVEEALAAGWTRDEVLAGECSQKTALRMGLVLWYIMRGRIVQKVCEDLNYMRLAVIAAHRPVKKSVHA